MTATTTTTSIYNWFYEQNSLTHASRSLVHFFDVHCMHDVKPPKATFYGGRGQYDEKFSFFYLNMDKLLKNSTPGKVAHI